MKSEGVGRGMVLTRFVVGPIPAVARAADAARIEGAGVDLDVAVSIDSVLEVALRPYAGRETQRRRGGVQAEVFHVGSRIGLHPHPSAKEGSGLEPPV